MSKTIKGTAYVVADNIDTDQIIPAQYLALVPTIEEEYKKLGGYALCGLPRDSYPTRLVEEDQAPSEYDIVIAGRNFGCGSSREHAPIALGAAGIKAVVAESFARIFFRNCIATGELYPVESKNRLCDQIKTGDTVEVDLENLKVRKVDGSVESDTAPLGEVEKVVNAGGLFAYARATGLVPQREG
jgi:3-isopropylmalate/(R)-2-methylmalate dehydratase small subunit